MTVYQTPTRAESRGSMRFRRRHHIGLGVVVGLVVAFLVGIVVVAPVALSHHDAPSLERAYGNMVVSNLALMNAAGIGPNPTSADAKSVLQGRTSYTGSCSQCHGPSGHTQGVFGRTSFPPASDLAGPNSRNLNDSQLFYIIKNGLGFTAMPGFSRQYSDTQIWNMVNFIRSMQQGQEPPLNVPTPTADQRSAAKLDTAGDAARGAEAFAAFACSTCHEPSGKMSINPANDNVANVVRSGKQGMPCYPTSMLSDDQLMDIRAYIATFPPEGWQGSPQDRAGGAPPPPQSSVPPGGASGGSAGHCSLH
jgi:mono/diheme cytochrome c family protein